MEEKQVMKVDMGASGVKNVELQYPSNSNKGRVEGKKVQKIVQGKVKQVKRTGTKRFLDSFFGDVGSSFVSFIVHDILITAAKGVVMDVLRGGVERVQDSVDTALYGDRKRPLNHRNNRQKTQSKFSYDKISSNRSEQRTISAASRSKHNFDDIVLDSRGEAQDVISHLVDLTIDYGQASVNDLYDLVGITGNFTDNKYGWEDLSSASISRTRAGYVLNLPRTIVIN